MRTLYLCGAGNSEGVRLALAVQRATQRWDRVALLDDDPSKYGMTLLEVRVEGGLERLAAPDAGDAEVVNLVARTCAKRAAMRANIAAFGRPFASLVHPAVDTSGARLGPGTLVYGGAHVGPEVVLAAGSVVFTGAVVGHETQTGEDCVVAANAVLNARVRLGDRVYVGSNASVVPEVMIGSDATIGLGSAVLRDVPARATAIGVPAEVFLPATPMPHEAPLAGSLPAASELRQRITEAWRAVLNLDVVGARENFFDLGGTSVLAVAAADRMSTATGLPLSLMDIFRYPTVSALADALAARHGGSGQTMGDHRRQIRHELQEWPAR